MRNGYLVAILALGACTSAGGQESDPSRPSDQRSFDVGAFEAVDLAGSHDVQVRVGGAPSVRAEGDAEALDRLDIKVENGVLKIGSKRRGFTDWGRDGKVRITVSAPALRSAGIAGSGDMSIDRAESDDFEASIAGSGDMTIAALRARRAEFDIAGSGNIRAAGAAEQAQISIAGSGNAALQGVALRQAVVSIAGSGDVHVQASETVAGSIVGSGDIVVDGGARCTVKKMGSGDIRCG